MQVLSKIEPQPPGQIMYMLGDEPWLPVHQRSPLSLHCEQWGNLGPLELNAAIEDNGHGFRVLTTGIPAPAGALGFTQVNGVYFWTDTDMYGRAAEERNEADPLSADALPPVLTDVAEDSSVHPAGLSTVGERTERAQPGRPDDTKPSSSDDRFSCGECDHTFNCTDETVRPRLECPVCGHEPVQDTKPSSAQEGQT